MAFDKTDLYTVDGGVNIWNAWTANVTKHDTSSFYNWEQDNLPLYDLEERTHYLWEKMGYPLSAVPGMALVVSSSIPTDMSLSTNVFLSVSAAIEALPEIIRMPTIIEVAVSGDIGKMELNNIKCEDDGALEIVNRGFAAIRQSENAAYDTNGADTVHYTPSGLSATETWTTIKQTSALSVSANVSSLFPAVGQPGYTRSFVTFPVTNSQSVPSEAFAGVAIESGAVNLTDDETYLQLSPIAPTGFSYSDTLDSTIGSNDLSTIDQRNNSDVLKSVQYTDSNKINGFVTANSLSSIKVQNSDGPIYIRGFVVDGQDTIETGVTVQNSAEVTLEYVGSMRCTTAGFDISNSKVYFRRGTAAMRNYDSGDRGTLTTYGYKLSNSNVEFQVDDRTVDYDYCFGSCYHDYGIYADDSVITGASSVNTGININSYYQVAFNATGIELHNSHWNVNGIVVCVNNGVGIETHASVFDTMGMAVHNSQNEGFLAKSTSITDNAAGGEVGVLAVVGGEDYNRLFWVNFARNGQHLVLDEGSSYRTIFVNGTTNGPAGRHIFFDHHGATDPTEANNKSSLPGVVVKGKAFFRNVWGQSVSVNTGPTEGLLFLADGGTIRFSGTAEGRGKNYFYGPIGTAAQKHKSLVGATNGGTVQFEGYNAVINAGVGISARKNSTINIHPVKDENGTNYTVSGLTVSSASVQRLQGAHTVMEIHSTQAGLYADSSKIHIQDLGDYRKYWGRTLTGNDIYENADYIPDYLDIVSSGALQFYPNPDSNLNGQDDFSNGNNFRSIANDSFELNNNLTRDADLSCLRFLYGSLSKTYADPNIATDFASIAAGGVCVRAVKGSDVFVKNVHFPMGHANADGSYYDISSSPALCDNLLIWQISDDTTFHASYLAVSGHYPSQAGYTGPRSFYASGTLGQGEDSSAVAYAVEENADTSTISVLDHFGSGVAVSANTLSNLLSGIGFARTGTLSYGPNSYENRGPFRIYFSTPAAAKHLKYVDPINVSAQVAENIAYQHLAQGYLLSGDCSTVATLSSIYPELIVYNTVDEVLEPSGYYYPSSLNIRSNPDNIWLDESAADTFANAKNASITYSGRERRLTIYRATTDNFGEFGTTSETGHGQGFRGTNLFDLDSDIS